MRQDLVALTKSGKTLGVRSFYRILYRNRRGNRKDDLLAYALSELLLSEKYPSIKSVVRGDIDEF